MKYKQLNKFLEDMTFNSSFRILEEGKDDDELIKIAKKRGIKLPSHDLACFKCIYAYTDRTNKNGCLLPKEEVEKSLNTLVGKAIDFDHFRKRVVGHWIDAELQDNEIIGYGIFYKGNFGEDYEIIKELFDKGNLSVSFEAWGERIYDKEGNYELHDIDWAGGGLLIKTEPAFDGANVLEIAKKQRVFEMAKVMTKPKEFVHSEEKSHIKEESRYYELQSIYQSISEVENLDGENKGLFEIMMVDFEKNKVKVRDITTDGELMIDLTPKAVVTKQGKKRNIAKIEDLTAISTIEDMDKYIMEFEGSDEELEIAVEESMEGPKVSHSERLELTDEDFAVVRTIQTEQSNKKIRLLPIPTLAHINVVQDRLGQSQVLATLEKLGVTKDNVEGKILRRANKITMKELIKKFEDTSIEEVLQEYAKATIERELTDSELEKAYSIVVYDKPKGDASDTSLLKVPAKKSGGNETSLINANITEDEIRNVIKEVTKAQEEVKVEDKKEEIPIKDKEKAKKEPEEKITDNVTDKDKEIAKLQEKLNEAEKKLEEINKAEKETLIKSRREDLGDKAKDMKDEDILDENKFMIAKLEKENELLRASTKKQNHDISFIKGSDDKEVQSEETSARKKVDSYAFGKEEASE